ncbi:MAG: UbiA family prenyltransferase [Beijerinckiaceae bacterium]|nr:UbiA family prenyltransferase [Beijerinckiaceae bacterium]
MDSRPLVIGLCDALVRTDLLIETCFAEVGRQPTRMAKFFRAALGGKASFKSHVQDTAEIDPANLPYDPAVIELIKSARAEGRPVYLASGSNGRLVERVAEHLGLFDGWFASTDQTNLSGADKAHQLVQAFGEGGYDYVGAKGSDLPAWNSAAKAVVLRKSKWLGHIEASEVEHLDGERPTWRAWAKLLRVHQYAKNVLVFAPLLASHVFTIPALSQAILAFIAFSLCASSVYILNDLVDLREDRGHRSKRTRPLASGVIPLTHGAIAAPLLLAASMLMALAVSVPFAAVLLGYFALTTAYSFGLKRMLLIDVIALAGLYTVRVLGGAVAVGVGVSEWLLGFCLMLFLSLALIKRYVELAARRDADLADPTSRDYKLGDLELVGALAAATGLNSVTIFALYISSDSVNQLYARPEILWLVAPLLFYWISRALVLACRRQMNDDPVVFALRDRASLVTVALAALLVVVAI